MEMRKITMNQISFEAALTHLFTFAQEAQQSTEVFQGQINLVPTPELPKLEYIGHCLVAILSAGANTTHVKPFDRKEIAEMLRKLATYFDPSMAFQS